MVTSSARGRPFLKGNPGRKPGSKNRTTVIAAALLEGEAEALVRKAVELAKGGDRQMLKVLLGTLLPRGRLITIDLRGWFLPKIQSKPSHALRAPSRKG
jgi:hypothetical protein